MAFVCMLTVCANSLLASAPPSLPVNAYERAIVCQALADSAQASDARSQSAGRAIAFALEDYVKSGKKRRKTILSDVSDAALKMDELDAASREAVWTQCVAIYAPPLAT